MVKKIYYRKDNENYDLYGDAADPNPDYALTMDNAKKILAIHQRLRWLCFRNIRYIYIIYACKLITVWLLKYMYCK